MGWTKEIYLAVSGWFYYKLENKTKTFWIKSNSTYSVISGVKTNTITYVE